MLGRKPAGLSALGIDDSALAPASAGSAECSIEQLTRCWAPPRSPGHFPAGPERQCISLPPPCTGRSRPFLRVENMPPKFKRHLNDDDVTGSVKSERRNLLEEDSDEEEDFFLRGPAGPRFGPRNDKIRHVQNQVDEVIDVMQENITKVIERGERLDDLQDKSESLSDNATAFSNRSKQLRRQMWWRGCKMKALVALVAVILLLVIISERFLLWYQWSRDIPDHFRETWHRQGPSIVCFQIGTVYFKLTSGAFPFGSVGTDKIKVRIYSPGAYVLQTYSTAQANCCISTDPLSTTGIPLLQRHVSVRRTRVPAAYGFQMTLSTKMPVSG
ncbi:Vesicle-associated membrane protein 4 [Platysternon megacephalum]|uniref:Vesicle-associated membrane protein 4 n=1 Tax=Platysternon megacephalum TaxID=55544 RepID=A0A4D9DQ05_9SAUR|nr:Vesicle-associated membrane protein 4 [Platysternon megacephalum]